jgi:predicted HD phosphohydrolase
MTAETSVQPFRSMGEATSEQVHRYITEGAEHLSEAHIPTVLHLFDLGKGAHFGAAVDRYTHSLQTATRAYRSNARLDMVVGALLHDVADNFAPMSHGAVAASMISKYVDEETAWVVEHHTVFQGYHFWDKLGLDKDARDQWAGNPYFDAAAAFCAEWDEVSFDERYDTLPIEFFVPALQELFARPVNGFA